ncbi:MAG TPA: response regulator [Clostridiaceae bacterium]|nr:response regulator [Clostridiaceae bacterium]
MYNILVVEDEQIMREGIEEILKENKNLNVYTARNGQVALEIIENNNIHGMILDIRMPKMTGIELLKELDRRNKRIETIILSGHDEFEYAKEAMKYGAIDYILKPFTPADVSYISEKLLCSIVAKEKKDREIEQLREQIEKNKSAIRERFFYDLLNKGMSQEILQEKLKFLDMELKGEFYQVFVIEIDDEDQIIKLKNEENYQIIVMSVYNRLKNYVDRIEYCELFHLSTNIFVILFNNNVPENNDAVYSALEKLLTEVREQLNISLSVGVGEILKGIKHIKTSYNQALHALKYKILLGGGNIINIWDLEKSDNTPIADFNEEEFISKIKLNQTDEVMKLLDDIFQSVKKSQTSLNLYSLNLICMRIITACLVALEETKTPMEDTSETKWSNPFNDFFKLKTLDEIINWTSKFVINCMEHLKRNRDKKSKSTIEHAKDIIHKNFKKDLSLADIAGALQLSKNYFGQIFKEQMGLTVNEYINMVRIKKAKELLENSTLRVYEIAYEVGFNDHHYFSSVFKKIVGVSPTEYRELL